MSPNTTPTVDRVDAEDQAHSVFSPSSMSRILSCRASLLLPTAKTTEADNDYTTEGTIAHNLIEYCGVNNLDPIAISQQKDNEYTQEMGTDAALFLDEVDKIREYYDDSQVFFEVREIHKVVPELGGTMDSLIVTEDDLFILDYKFGAGIPVEVKGNAQLLSYAIIAMSIHGRKNCHFTVVQPRRPHADGLVRHWSPDHKDIVEFGDQLLACILWYRNEHKRITEGKSQIGDYFDLLTPTVDNCRFCDKKAGCPALKSMAYKAQLMADSLDLSPDYLKWMLDNESLIRKHIDAVKDHALAVATDGVAIPDYKLITKYGRRVWACDIATLRKTLDELGFSSVSVGTLAKPKTPAQIEKDVPRELIAHLITAHPTGTKLVPMSSYGDDLNSPDGAEAFAAAMANDSK